MAEIHFKDKGITYYSKPFTKGASEEHVYWSKGEGLLEAFCHLLKYYYKKFTRDRQWECPKCGKINKSCYRCFNPYCKYELHFLKHLWYFRRLELFLWILAIIFLVWTLYFGTKTEAHLLFI